MTSRDGEDYALQEMKKANIMVLQEEGSSQYYYLWRIWRIRVE